MSGQGFILLYRRIWECWIWEDANDLKRWIDLLMLANHSDKKIKFDGELITISRGQYLTSIRKLADRWGCTTKTVRRFLELLESDSMILRKSTPRATLINIVNYEVYQGFTDEKGTVSNTVSNTLSNTVSTLPSPHSVPTNNNDKTIINNDKQKREATAKRFCPPSIEEVRAYCSERNNGINAETFVDFYASKGWKVGKNPMKDWKACVRTWEKRNHPSTTPQQVKDEIMVYSIDETDERPPFYGFPPEWFEDGKLIEERITKIKQPAMKYRGLYEDVVYSEKELLEKYKMRKEWFDNHDSR